jgi:hypothetical protein
MTIIRKLLIGAGSAALLAGLATAASAQSNTSSDSAAVNASIIQAISITKDNDVEFGTIARPTSGTSTITINPTTNAEAESGAGDATIITAGSRGQFTVAGDGAQTYTLSGDTATVTLTEPVSSATLTFTPNVVAASGTLGTLGGTLYTEATQVLYAGGAFDVTSTTTPGAYTGSLTLTVTYN